MNKETFTVETDEYSTTIYRNASGYKAHWTFDKKLTEVEIKAWQAQQTAPLHNTTTTIDGIEYTLKAK